VSRALARSSADTTSGSGSGSKPVIGRFGRYVLVDRLGAGGMAEVFRALVLGPEQFQRVVVVKRILPQFSASPSFIQMFIDEARLCGRLSHPNIIQVYEFGNHDDQYFITMEYVEGKSLGHIQQRLHDRRERMPPSIAAEIARHMCRGLAYAHALTAEDGKPLGIVHRDLSPGNVIVGYNGLVKVLDFGIARVENRFRIGSTDPGCVKGKSSYLAPEQITGRTADRRADIFTVGIVLYEMLTGTRLFRGDNSTESINMIRAMHIAPPSQRNPAVPVRLDAIVMRALRRQVDERYQDATELADALEGFLLEHRVSSQELPSFMRGLFGPEIGSDQIRFTREEIEALIGPLPPEATGPEPADLASGSADPVIDVDLEDPLPRSRRKLPALLLAGAMAVAAVLFAVWRPGSTGPAVASVAPVTAPARTEPRREAPPRALAREVKLAIGSDPPGATVYQAGSPAPIGQTPLSLVRPQGSGILTFQLKKASYQDAELQVVPDADKPAAAVLVKSADRRSRPRAQKVRNAVPIDPFE
jgi:serine/threonine protein kinase